MLPKTTRLETTPLIAEFLFWLSFSGLFYIYLGYPLLIWSCARIRPRSPRKADGSAPVSVVIAAHNEADHLQRKINDLLHSANQKLLGEVLIASDGSTDATAEIVDSFDDPRVKLLHWPDRRGKAAVLNDAVPQCGHDVVVLTDARQELSAHALQQLVSHFADESVGVVSGELVLRDTEDSTTAAQGIGFYWRYEKFIRRQESRFRSVPGATGALYAIRKQLFRPISPQTLLDDVVIPMQAVVQGYRCVFEPNAVAYDVPSQSPDQESIRKRRTIAGNAQLIAHHPDWLLPWRNPIWLEFVSHKIGRLFSPLLLLVALWSNIALISQPLYAVLLALHVDCYLAAIAGWAYQRAGGRSSWFGVPLMFMALNATTAAALWDAIRGRFQPKWRRAG